MKMLKDFILLMFLYIAMTNMGKAEGLESDDGGVKLNNGCYTLILLIKQDDGSMVIRTVQDCRGGRPIWKELV